MLESKALSYAGCMVPLSETVDRVCSVFTVKPGRFDHMYRNVKISCGSFFIIIPRDDK